MREAAPPITGLLETSLYADDVKATAGFYRELFEFRTLVDSSRLVAFEVADRHVLLVFQRGATEDDVVDGRGTIPGHDGAGRLHLALSIAAADLDAWRARLAEAGIADRGRLPLAAGRDEPLFSRSRRRARRARDAGLVVVSHRRRERPRGPQVWVAAAKRQEFVMRNWARAVAAAWIAGLATGAAAGGADAPPSGGRPAGEWRAHGGPWRGPVHAHRGAWRGRTSGMAGSVEAPTPAFNPLPPTQPSRGCLPTSPRYDSYGAYVANPC